MSFNHNHFVEILIKKRNTKYEIVAELVNFLGLDPNETRGSHIRMEDYNLHCYDNSYNSIPSVYSSANVKSDFFDIRLVFESKINDLDKIVVFIEKILKFYWDKSIPAAINSYEFDELLPWLGGNDLRKVFWIDENFPPASFIEFCKSNIDWQYVIEKD